MFFAYTFPFVCGDTIFLDKNREGYYPLLNQPLIFSMTSATAELPDIKVKPVSMCPIMLTSFTNSKL